MKASSNPTTEQTKPPASKTSAGRERSGLSVKHKGNLIRLDDRFGLAIDFKLNSRKTNCGTNGNLAWLKKAGYSDTDITPQLRVAFKRTYSRQCKQLISPSSIEEEDQPWHKHWVRKLQLSENMKKILTAAVELFPMSNQRAKGYFERIGETSIKQRFLDRTCNRNVLGSTLIAEIYKECTKFLEEQGIPEDLKVDLNRTLIQALFNDNDSEIKFQDPHTDYPYMIISRADFLANPRYFSWTAHMPITDEGSWITLWFGPGEGHTMHIPYGEILLIRSDLVHGGGIPLTDRLAITKTFCRLHFHIVSADQPATPGKTYGLSYDNYTELSKIHVQPKCPFI